MLVDLFLKSQFRLNASELPFRSTGCSCDSDIIKCLKLSQPPETDELDHDVTSDRLCLMAGPWWGAALALIYCSESDTPCLRVGGRHSCWFYKQLCLYFLLLRGYLAPSRIQLLFQGLPTFIEKLGQAAKTCSNTLDFVSGYNYTHGENVHINILHFQFHVRKSIQIPFTKYKPLGSPESRNDCDCIISQEEQRVGQEQA